MGYSWDIIDKLGMYSFFSARIGDAVLQFIAVKTCEEKCLKHEMKLNGVVSDNLFLLQL